LIRKLQIKKRDVGALLRKEGVSKEYVIRLYLSEMMKNKKVIRKRSIKWETEVSLTLN